MAKRATVPKFGAWDSNNVGYTVYFDKVRENKVATAPPLQRPYNPNDPDEGPMVSVPGPTSRPGTEGGHRRAGSSSSAASEPSSGGRGAEQSKFAPPPQYYQRPSPQPQQPAQQQQQYRGSGGQHHGPAPAGHGHGGGGGDRDRERERERERRAQRQQRHAEPAPRAQSASPQNNPIGRQRPTAVPKFGVWDEQTTSAAAQGFTVMFDNAKRHRDVARKAVPAVPQAPPPPPPRPHHRGSFSKMFGCLIPNVKE